MIPCPGSAGSLPFPPSVLTAPPQRLTRIHGLLSLAVAVLTLVPASVNSADVSPPPVPRRTIAIENAQIVDVRSGRTLAPRTVLIVDGMIDAIGEPESIAIPPSAQRVEGRGRFLLPGLVDMHVHLFNNSSRRPPNDWTFPLFVVNGVTGIREMRSEPAQIATVADWRAKVSRGELIAPHILAAGVAVRGDSVESARRQVREAQAAGADFIKMFSTVPEAHWRAIIDEARTAKIPVAGHTPYWIRLVEAAQAGQRTNEHLTQGFEASTAREAHWIAGRDGLTWEQLDALLTAKEPEMLQDFDAAACARMAAALAQAGQAQVPTLVLLHLEQAGAREGFREDPRWKYLRSDEHVRWEQGLASRTAADDEQSARRWAVSRKIVAAMNAAGVHILTGTDTPMPLNYPGYSLHQELALLVECSLSPAEALRAATLWPAELLGLGESQGAVEVGKRADLVLLSADPLADIRNTQQIHAVILDGRLLNRADLDGLLEAAGRGK